MAKTTRPSLASAKRAAASRPRRGTQSPAIGRAMALQALETWLVPVLALSAAAAFWLLASFEVWSDTAGVVAVAGALLILTVFASFRHYFFADNPRNRNASLGFAVLWTIFVFVCFYRHNFPGDPLAVGVLRPGGDTVRLPEAGLYAVVVDGRFTAAEGQGNRLGHYRLDAAAAGQAEQSIAGDFEDSFARQRLGRRGTTVVEVQHTAQRHVVRLPSGSTLRVVEIDKSLDPELRVAVYPATSPWFFPVFGAVGFVLALVLEKWLDGDGSATMGVSVTYFAVDQYLRWSSPHPQMKTLIGFILFGGILGAPLAAIVWRMVPRRWVLARR